MLPIEVYGFIQCKPKDNCKTNGHIEHLYDDNETLWASTNGK